MTSRALGVAAVFLGCGASTPPPTLTPTINWFTMDTGESCVHAEVACGAGNCAARIDNRCRAPKTCELTIQCVCQAFTGESGEARSHARETVPAGAKFSFRAHAICSDGEVFATHAESVGCH